MSPKELASEFGKLGIGHKKRLTKRQRAAKRKLMQRINARRAAARKALL